MNTNSECVYTVYTYSECVVTVNSSRRAALEAQSTRGGTRVCRASGVFTENVAPAKLSVESTPDWAAPRYGRKTVARKPETGVKC
jgi:hypothetical protein